MIRITVYAGVSPDDSEGPYNASVLERGFVSERDVSEELRRLGLEWHQADYFPRRQTVIVLDPVDMAAESLAEIKTKVREAASMLEENGAAVSVRNGTATSGQPDPDQSARANHRVVLTFDDGLNHKLICPKTGCEPASVCGECHRQVDDEERGPCAACPKPDDGCWVKGWFDNCTYDELLHGEMTVEVECEWDGDHIIAEVVDAERDRLRDENEALRKHLEHIAETWKWGNGAGPYARRALDESGATTS